MNERLTCGKAQWQPGSCRVRRVCFRGRDMDLEAPRKSGFTLVEIMIVVCIVSLVAAIAIPSIVRASSASHQTTCINNLRQIRGAIAQWALEANASVSTPVQYTNILPFLRGSVICPAGGTSFCDSYTITDVQTPPTCKQVPDGPSGHTVPPDCSQ
jgi:prepilin-type N-terminal cleavage/methylation domain-containing protein